MAHRPLPLDPIDEARRQWVAHGWSGAADGMAAVTSVMRAQQILLSRAEQALRPLGLSFARYEVLMLLLFSRSGELPVKTISSRLQVHSTSATHAVARLHAAGLVARAQHPDDRRAVLVSLTEPGRQLAHEATLRLNRDVFQDIGIPRRRVGTLLGVLRELRQRAGDF